MGRGRLTQWGSVSMSQQTPSEHPCDGCNHYAKGMCKTGPERFPECWEPCKIVTPLERKLDEL